MRIDVIRVRFAAQQSPLRTLRACCARDASRRAPGKITLAKCAGDMVVGALRAHALRAVRQFVWLEVGSVKMAFSRPVPSG
jgi:hypothetical protein